MAGQKGSSRGTIRWRPTSEQLMILEELFKGGIKSPTSQQVQKITAKLKDHGKVESKNVFYWFQNHKAREKQKLKRKQQNQQQQQLNMDFAYYNVHPPPHPQFACGFWPLYPPQVIKGQWISSPAEMTNLLDKQTLVTRKNVEETQDQANESSWEITWLPHDSESDHHHKNRPLETLQLFPTTTSATTETTAAATTTTTTTTTSASSNVSSSSRILISL